MADSNNTENKIENKIENKANNKKKLSALEFANLIKVHIYYKDFIKRKYKDKVMSLKDWEKSLKNDGLEL